MLFWVLGAISLFMTIFLFLLLSMFWPPDSPWAPWWRTNKTVARAMCRLAKLNDKDVVYDLGCGDGTALSVAAGEFGASGVGIEIDPLRYLFSKIRFRISGLNEKVKIVKDNFNNVDLSKATVVFVYLVPRALERLRPKLLKELKKGTLLASFRYKINLPLTSYNKNNNIYLYEI
jgi:16S rRNA A1518/A1519 N6-dimethyltransferase RsmA/KsgA/DIM1 with predicted DNA glycosylase/AP lyase activity